MNRLEIYQKIFSGNLDLENIFIRNEQPTVCSKCGARTEILLEFDFIKEILQIHECLNFHCRFLFADIDDEDFAF